MKREDKVLPYVLILPGVFIVVLTILYPILLTLIYSLQFYKLTKPYDRKIIGLQNYIEIFKDFDFYTALINTGIIIGVVLVVGTILSFTIALILNRDTKLSNILTAVAIIPWALPPVVNGVIWKFIFYPEFGLINKILYSLGIVDGAILWLNNRYISLIILGIILSWRVIPFCSILILANIKAIPDDIFEAAQVDGASTFYQIKDILLPILKPSFIIVIVNLILAGINIFDEVVALVGFRKIGEPFMLYNYNQTFSFFNIGYGSAISYMLTIILGALGFLYIRFLKKVKRDEKL